MMGHLDDIETLKRIKERRAVWPPASPSHVDPVTLLIRHAQTDTGGAGKCAMFLLSLWNGHEFKVDLQDLLHNDSEIFSAMMAILNHLFGANKQIEDYVSQAEMDPIIQAWGKAFNYADK